MIYSVLLLHMNNNILRLHMNNSVLLLHMNNSVLLLHMNYNILLLHMNNSILLLQMNNSILLLHINNSIRVLLKHIGMIHRYEDRRVRLQSTFCVEICSTCIHSFINKDHRILDILQHVFKLKCLSLVPPYGQCTQIFFIFVHIFTSTFFFMYINISITGNLLIMFVNMFTPTISLCI